MIDSVFRVLKFYVDIFFLILSETKNVFFFQLLSQVYLSEKV